MDYLKKITCTLLCTIYAVGILGLTGCQDAASAEKKRMVLDSAANVSELVKSRDYNSLSAYLFEDNENLKKAFKLGEGVDDEKTVAVRRAISYTLRYEIKEETLDYSFFGQVGTVNVEFKLVDYEKFAKENDSYRDVEYMEKKISEYSNKQIMIYTMPMRFVFRDGKAVLENTELLEQLYSFSTFDGIVFAENLTKYLGNYTFVGSEDGVYNNPDSLTLEIELDEKGQKYDWKYDYEVAYTGTVGGEKVIFTGTDETIRGSEKILIRYSSNQSLEDGTYRISILYGGEKADYECKAEGIVKRYSDADAFVCPSGDTLKLSLSKITVKLPEGYFFVDEGTPLGDKIIESFGRSIVEFIVSDDDSEKSQEYLFSVYAADYNQTTEDQVIDYFADTRKTMFKNSGASITSKKGKIKIGKKKYKYSDLWIEKDGNKEFLRLILSSTKTGYHLIMIMAKSEKSLKKYTSMLH